MGKLLALLLALMLCALPALAEVDAQIPDEIDETEALETDDDAIDEWLYEEDEEDDEQVNGDEFADIGMDDLSDEESAAQDTEQADLMGAMEIYSWFALEPLDVDESMPDPTGTMWRVLDERFNTMESMLDILHFYFSVELVDELWNSSTNPYKEINGFLYTNGEGREIDERVGETEVTVTSQTDDKITLSVQVHYTSADEYGTEDETFTYERELIENQWKYTLFPFFW